MYRKKQYDYDRIDRRTAQDDWYLQRRREIVAEQNSILKKPESGGIEMSSPGDVHEQQADSIAQKVVNGGEVNLGAILSAASSVQKKAAGESLSTTTEFANELNSSKGSGQPMDDSTRTEMESKMGADFSDVKIHTGSTANSLNRQINAQAFTEGSDIYFNEGKYNPESNQGKELLAHELVHTVQQGEGVNRKVMRSPGDKWSAGDNATLFVWDENSDLIPVLSLKPGTEVTELPFNYDERTMDYLYVSLDSPDEKNKVGFIKTSSLISLTVKDKQVNNTTNQTITDAAEGIDNNQNNSNTLNASNTTVSNTDNSNATIVQNVGVKNRYGYSGPERDDISWKTELSQTQQTELNWSVIIQEFQISNPGIPSKTLRQWVRKSLHEGWVQGKDQAPSIRQVMVVGFDEKDVPIIEAYTYADAFAYANKIKKESNSLEQKKRFNQFHWQTKISQTVKPVSGTAYASATAYKNYTTNKLLPVIDFEALGNISGSLDEASKILKIPYYSDKLLSNAFVNLTLAVQQTLYPGQIELWTGIYDAQTRKDADVKVSSFNGVVDVLSFTLGMLPENEQFKMAIYNGYKKTEKDFSAEYGSSFLKYIKSFRPDLVALNGGTLIDNYAQSVHAGFEGGIYAFYLTYEGSFEIFNKLHDSYTDMSKINSKDVNQKLTAAKSTGSVIKTFSDLVFDAASKRLDDNIKNLNGWKIYISSIGESNLNGSVLSARYTNLREGAEENGRFDMLESWLNEPDPGKRGVYEKFIDGYWSGGCQYCHSSVKACNEDFLIPDTQTPVQQIRSAVNAEKMRMAPISIMSPVRVSNLYSGIEKLPPGTNQISNGTGQVLSNKEKSDLILYLQSIDQPSSNKGSTGNLNSGNTTSTSVTSNPNGTNGTSASQTNNTFYSQFYPTINEADELTPKLNTILNLLGPNGFNVIPLDVFNRTQAKQKEELRSELLLNIDSRISDFNVLKGRIASAKADPFNSLLKFWHFRPVMSDVMATVTDDDIKKQVNDYIKIQQALDTIQEIEINIIGIALMFIPGAQLLGGLILAGNGLKNGIQQMYLGSTLSLGKGAPNVIDKGLAESGDMMFLSGALNVCLSAISLFMIGSAALQPKAPVGNPNLPVTVESQQFGNFTVTKVSNTEICVTNSAEFPGCYVRAVRFTPNGPTTFNAFKFNPQTQLFEEIPIPATFTSGAGPINGNLPVPANNLPVYGGSGISTGRINQTTIVPAVTSGISGIRNTLPGNSTLPVVNNNLSTTTNTPKGNVNPIGDLSQNKTISNLGGKTDNKFDKQPEWLFWSEYEKLTISGEEFAVVGKRFYSQTAVENALPSQYKLPPSVVDDVITSGTAFSQTQDGIVQRVFDKGDLRVVTEQNGLIVRSISKLDFEKLGIDNALTHVKHRDMTNPNRRDIVGCHDEVEFFGTLNTVVAPYTIPPNQPLTNVPQVIIVSDFRPPNIPGVRKIQYQIPALNNNVTSGLPKADIYEKTLYDPTIWTDQMLTNALKEALHDANLKNGAFVNGSKYHGFTKEGYTIEFWYRNDVVQTFYFIP